MLDPRVYDISALPRDLQQITTDGTNKRDPRFVDGGNAVVYCYDETPDLIRMMKIEIGDKQAEPVFAIPVISTTLSLGIHQTENMSYSPSAQVTCRRDW